MSAEVSALKTTGFWYLASPYSHPDPLVRSGRAAGALEVSSRLLAHGVHVYSPIHAAHAAAVQYRLPKDHLFWLAFNKAFLDPADGVLIAELPGWRESEGVRQEACYAIDSGKPVYTIDGQFRAHRIWHAEWKGGVV